MSLAFTQGTTQQVSFGKGTSLNDLSAVTYIVWFYRTAGDATSGALLSKGTFGAGAWYSLQVLGADAGATANRPFLFVRLSGTSVNTASAAINALPLNAWAFVAMTYDDGTKLGSVYFGTMTAAVAFDSSNMGAGTRTSDASNELWMGQNPDAPTATASGQIGFAAVYNRVLTLAELAQIQFTRCVLPGCALQCFPGFNTTGTQPDLSGNGNNGTLANSPTLADDIPLSFPFGFDDDYPYVVTLTLGFSVYN